MKRIIFITILLFLLPVVGRCQVASVLTEYGDLLPSRGAYTVVKGTNLSNGLTETAVSIADLPRDLAGVTVDINGVQCGLRYVTDTEIRMVVPDEVPFVTPVRLRPNVLTVRNSAGQVWTRRVYLNDTSPWLLPNKATQWPVGVAVSQAGFANILNGVIEVKGETRVQLFATGARSFYPADWVSYYVYIIDSNENVYEIPAAVSKGVILEGLDFVTFDIPVELARLGTCRLLLRTPSAFSNEVEVTIQ